MAARTGFPIYHTGEDQPPAQTSECANQEVFLTASRVVWASGSKWSVNQISLIREIRAGVGVEMPEVSATKPERSNVLRS